MAEIHDRSAAQESSLAAAVGGKVSGRSGAGWLRKGDVRSSRFLYEAKTTSNKSSYTIKADDLKKIRQHAFVAQRMPVLTFDLAGRRYHIVEDATWLEVSDGG